MNYLQQDTNAATVIWPITRQGKTIAQQFSCNHAQPAIAERVRRNTLAVWVIHDFLEALGVPTDLSTSDSWNPALQLVEDVADLVIPELGKLECRPVCIDKIDEACNLPLEVLSERIGYIAVALDEAASEAALLGFVSEIPPVQQPYLRLERLLPMADFPDHLHNLRQEAAPSQLTRLSRWLEGQFESGWQSAEELLAQYFWTPAFRQGGQTMQQEAPLAIKRAKQLDLGLKLGTEQIALVLEVGQEMESVVNVGVRLYPLGGAMYLPEGLTITILDRTETVCLKAQARSIDNYLQLYFRGQPGEPFTTQVNLGDVQIAEHFVI